MDYGLEREFYEERRRKWRRSGFWRGVVFVIVLICLGLGAAFWAGRTATHPHIAEIWIDGVIVEDNAREALLQDLAQDRSPCAPLLCARFMPPCAVWRRKSLWLR